MSVVQYASKFMEFSHFAPAYVASETLKVNQFKFGLNHKLKVVMSVRNTALIRICTTQLSAWSELITKGRHSSTNKGKSERRGHKTTGISNRNTRGSDRRAHKAARQGGISKA